jgi:hypothetical protein
LGGHSLHEWLCLDLKFDLWLWGLLLFLLEVSVEAGLPFAVVKPGGRGVLFCFELSFSDY